MTEAFATGLIALAGVLVGYLVQFATSFSERHERRQRLNREKFESLCELIQSSTLEVQGMMNQVGDNAMVYIPTSASRAHYLALIYFPDLADVTRDYANDTALFRSFLYGSGFRPEIPASIGAQALMSNPQYKERVHRLHLRRAAVEEKIGEVARKYTRA